MPTAPPAWLMLLILSVKLHAPRSTSTTNPDRSPVKGAQPLRLEPSRSPYWIGPAMTSPSARGTDHGWNTAGNSSPVLSSVISCSTAEGTWVCATLSAVGAAAGEPVMYGLSAELPAEATVSTPTALALSTASERSSSKAWPYGEPSDMLMMSTWSDGSPSPSGSTANSMPWISAMPEHDVETDEQTLTA